MDFAELPKYDTNMRRGTARNIESFWDDLEPALVHPEVTGTQPQWWTLLE